MSEIEDNVDSIAKSSTDDEEYTSGVTCNNCKDGPLTSSTVAIDACYILLASQRCRYSKYHSFEFQSYILHSNTPIYSANNAESNAI